MTTAKNKQNAHLDVEACKKVLDREREAKGMSVHAFAKMLGITNASLQKYLYDINTMPSCENLCRMADALDCSVDYLCGRTNVKKYDEAIAADELHLPEDVIEILKYQCDEQPTTYATVMALLSTPAFWDTMSVVDLLTKCYAMRTEPTAGNEEIKIVTSEGRRYVGYSLTEGSAILLRHIGNKFATGIQFIMEMLADINRKYGEVDYEKLMLTCAKQFHRRENQKEDNT